MKTISSVKELFALAGCDIDAREKVIAQTLVVGTEDWYYYRGLVLLQKLSAALSDVVTIRSPTEQERVLLKDLKHHLKDYNNRFPQSTRCTELKSRFYLLTWYINNDACKRYIRESLHLNLPMAQHQFQHNDNNPSPSFQSTLWESQQQQQQQQSFATATEKTYPSSLDASLLDHDRFVWQILTTNQLDQLNFKSWPIIQQHWPQLNNDQRTKILVQLLKRPVSTTHGTVPIPIVDYLVDIWRPFGNNTRRGVLAEAIAKIPLNNLTLDQMDQLQTMMPLVLHTDDFVKTYIEKLVPDTFAQNSVGFFTGNQAWWNEWEDDDAAAAATTNDDPSTWDLYLDTLDRFADKLLDGPFRLVKARITFQRLKLGLLHGVFDQSLLLAYLSQSQVKVDGFSVDTPTPHRSSSLFGRSDQTLSIKIPLLGSCDIPTAERTQIIEQYITGLLQTQKLDSLAVFGAYLDQKTFLEPLEAQVMLTSGLAKKEDITGWSKVLGSSGFTNLANKMILTFGLETIHDARNSKLTQDDVIPVHVTIKNIPRLTIRIFPVDLFNYWKLHPNDNTIKDGNKLNVDGLCPVYEHQLDYSDTPSLQIVNETFVFGGDSDSETEKSIATELFQGRGVWMIDFIGGQHQCRAIVQKGYLRHTAQDTAAGHLFRIMDEKNQPMGNTCSLWFENSSHEADEFGNILIPYRSKDIKKVRALFVTKTGYCQPVAFYHQEERYSLTAHFYLNYESLVPTKRAKIIIMPTLTIQDQVLPLQLLKKMSLQIVTTNASNIKSSTSIDNLKTLNGKPLECEFVVPKSLVSIQLTLSAKIKTMSKDEQWKHLEFTREIRDKGPDQTEVTTTHMRTSTSGYYICVIGKNGEPHKRHVVELSFAHTFTLNTIDITMQTDENGQISLGKLDQIQSVTAKQLGKTWNLLGDNWESIGNYDEAALPATIRYYADTEFKIPFAVGDGCTCTLYKTGFRQPPVADYTNRLKYTDSSVTVVGGLPEGCYIFYLTRPHQRLDDLVEVIIMKDRRTQHNRTTSTKNDTYWNDWIIDTQNYGKISRDIIKQPLGIENVKITNDTLTLKLKNVPTSTPTFALVTNSAFLPSLTDSLSNPKMKRTRFQRLLTQKMGRSGMEHIYLTGRTLGEELQYILNRAKEDKYLGSTLVEPTLLVNPKENKSTMTVSRTTGKGNHGFTDETKQKHPNTIMFRNTGGHRPGMGNPLEYTNFDFEFLNHSTRVLVLPANDQGEVMIDLSQLGDGNLLQAAVLSGEQMVSRTLVLPQATRILKLNDQRQTDQGLDVNAAYLRNKIVTVLSPSHPQHSMEIDQTQHESELVGCQEMLLDIFKLLAPHQSKELADFDMLRQWGTWSDDEKLKAHDEMNCNELNLWVKYKDARYFENNIKPFIKSKIHKTFMDDYLIDADLSTYANDLYLFQQLNTAEKALLAKRVPQILPVVLQIFKDNYTKNISDQPFDTVLAGNSLTLPPTETLNAFGSTTRPPPPPPPPPSTGYNGPSEPSSATVSSQSTGLFGSSQSTGLFGSSQRNGGFGSSTQPQPTTQSTPAYGFGSAAPQSTKSLFGAPPPPPPPPPAAPAASIFGAPTPAPAASIFGTATTTQASAATPASTGIDVNNTKDPDTDPDGTAIYDDVDGSNDSEGNEIDAIMELRNQAAKRRQAQQPYEYMGKTMEWEEQEYYDKAPGMINVNQFWIDYLENKLDMFVSANAIYATSSIAEMIFALALLDLPIKLNARYDVASDLTTGKITITATTPLMVFYRSLKKYTQPLVASHTLLLGQHFFERNRNSDGSTGDECIVEPSQLLVHTPYGWHLAISNISTKPVVCEVTLQIPTGAVPLGETTYCQSMNIRIEPYTTWHEVVGTFYFPEQDTFYQFPVTIGGQPQDKNESEGIGSSSSSEMVLLNQTKPLVMTVNELKRASESNEQTQRQESTAPLPANASWSVVNSTGTSDDILAFIENHGDKLQSFDWSLVMWRMANRIFARSLLTLLAGRKHYVKSIYAYGVYHAFNDIIADLLVQERFLLLQKTGIVFDSPLVKWHSYGNHRHKVLDYYPMANARVHTLGSSQEIANQEFYKQYDLFLTYMNESIQRTANDYLILSVYLILLGRIGEARQAHIQSQKLFNERDDDHETTSIQEDYLAAYLATRIKVGDEMDWALVKKMITKYKTCGSLRWRKLFAQLNDLVVQVEKCDLQDMTNDKDSGIMARTKANLGTDPVFDFTIKDNQVVVRYANLTEIQVRLYNINVEVMFSNQPFLNKVNKMSDYGWVQANHVETIKLPDDQSDDNVVTVDDANDDDDDFGWIGISKARHRCHTFPIPLVGNLLVEMHAHGKTRCQTHYNHALTIHLSDQNGLARVLTADSLEHHRQKALSGVYVKVYAKLNNGRVEFWKDGYTGLTGIFDYISITHGNALTGSTSLEEVVKNVRKFALLFASEQYGVVVKEIGIPL